MDDQPIESLQNLGTKSAAWLREAGISTVATLQRVGAAAAYRHVKLRRPATSLNLLWALAAGLEGKHWRELSAEEKERLRREAGGG